MPGAWGFKHQVDDMVSQAMVAQRRREMGLPVGSRTNHLIVTGNAGTGKTTVTRQLGELMYELGLVEKPEVVETSRDQLYGEYVNQVTGNVRDFFKKNRGKVIFIDEAYTLYQGANDLTGQQGIDEIMRLAEEYRDDTMIVLAGYKPEMNQLFKVNQGLKSRFPNKVDLPDLTPDEKRDVLDWQVTRSGDRFDDKKTADLARAFAAQVPSTGENGNARAIRNFLDTMATVRDRRLFDAGLAVDADGMTTFTASDVSEAAARVGLPPLVTQPKKQAREGYRRRQKAGAGSS